MMKLFFFSTNPLNARSYVLWVCYLVEKKITTRIKKENLDWGCAVKPSFFFQYKPIDHFFLVVWASCDCVPLVSLCVRYVQCCLMFFTPYLFTLSCTGPRAHQAPKKNSKSSKKSPTTKPTRSAPSNKSSCGSKTKLKKKGPSSSSSSKKNYKSSKKPPNKKLRDQLQATRAAVAPKQSWKKKGLSSSKKKPKILFSFIQDFSLFRNFSQFCQKFLFSSYLPILSNYFFLSNLPKKAHKIPLKKVKKNFFAIFGLFFHFCHFVLFFL